MSILHVTADAGEVSVSSAIARGPASRWHRTRWKLILIGPSVYQAANTFKI